MAILFQLLSSTVVLVVAPLAAVAKGPKKQQKPPATKEKKKVGPKTTGLPKGETTPLNVADFEVYAAQFGIKLRDFSQWDSSVEKFYKRNPALRGNKEVERQLEALKTTINASSYDALIARLYKRIVTETFLIRNQIIKIHSLEKAIPIVYQYYDQFPEYRKVLGKLAIAEVRDAHQLRLRIQDDPNVPASAGFYYNYLSWLEEMRNPEAGKQTPNAISWKLSFDGVQVNFEYLPFNPDDIGALLVDYQKRILGFEDFVVVQRNGKLSADDQLRFESAVAHEVKHAFDAYLHPEFETSQMKNEIKEKIAADIERVAASEMAAALAHPNAAAYMAELAKMYHDKAGVDKTVSNSRYKLAVKTGYAFNYKILANYYTTPSEQSAYSAQAKFNKWRGLKMNQITGTSDNHGLVLVNFGKDSKFGWYMYSMTEGIPYGVILPASQLLIDYYRGLFKD